MQTLVFSNIRGTLSFGQTAPYYLQTIEGVSGLKANIVLQSSPKQDGTTYISSNYSNRNITMTIVIKAANLAALNALKYTVSNIMCPKIKSTLTYTNGAYSKIVDVYCENSPVFSQQNKDDCYQTFFISLLSPNPFWVDILEQSDLLKTSLPLMHFYLEIVEPYELESAGEQRVVINNIGDEVTPVVIVFNGPATNPKLTNEATGEYIAVTQTLLTGETLTINTEFGNKSVIFDDGTTEVNRFGYIDLASTFFQLQIGNNSLFYEADAGSDTSTVEIRYRNRYVGI